MLLQFLPLIDVQDIGFHSKLQRLLLRDSAMTSDTCSYPCLGQILLQCATNVTTLIFRSCPLEGTLYSDVRRALQPSRHIRVSPQQLAVHEHRPPMHRYHCGHLQNLCGQNQVRQRTLRVVTERTQTEATYIRRVQDRPQA